MATKKKVSKTPAKKTAVSKKKVDKRPGIHIERSGKQFKVSYIGNNSESLSTTERIKNFDDDTFTNIRAMKKLMDNPIVYDNTGGEIGHDITEEVFPTQKADDDDEILSGAGLK